MSSLVSMEQIRTVVERQLEADHCLAEGTLEENRSAQLLTAPRLPLEKMAPARRRFKDHFELRLSNYRGTTLICAQYRRVLEKITAALEGDAGNWIGDYSKLRHINDFLTPTPLQNSGTTLYFTPSWKLMEFPTILPTPENYEIYELTAEQWETFRGDQRFSNALGFNELRPDTAVLVALYEGETIAMAGASEDSDLMWQIGVDVLPEHRRQGLGTILVQRLARLCLEQGAVPFYGTSPSHIQSQLLAQRAGFEPTWWEFVSSSLLEASVD